jgi:anti-anti-sigma factor
VRLSRHTAGIEVYMLAGEIDAPAVPLLRHLIYDTELRRARRVLVDLTHVVTICAAGVRELAYASVHARATYRCLSMVVSTAAVRAMLAAHGLFDRLTIHDSLAEAVGHRVTGTAHRTT